MTDDLDKLKAALKTATPTPDASARDKALALAQRNFDILQQATHSARSKNAHEIEQIGFFSKALWVFENFGLRFGLYATSGVAFIGIGITFIMPELTKKNLFDYFQYGAEPAELSAIAETTASSVEIKTPLLKEAQLSETIVLQEKNEEVVIHELVKLGVSADTGQTLGDAGPI